MSGKYVFQTISGDHLVWHPELGEGDNRDNYAEWLWIDGQAENGYHYSVGLFQARPDVGDPEAGIDTPDNLRWPTVDLRVLAPDGKVRRAVRKYPPELFNPEPYGGIWENTTFKWNLAPDGLPAGYEANASVDDIEINITAKTVITGVHFSRQDHGFTYYHPVKKLALGWWPLVPRAEVEGTIKVGGTSVDAKGIAYLEKQLTNIPNSFGGGAQNMWFWGHFFAGDYTAVWTDSAASEHFRYKHFTPFVMWEGSDMVLGTFQLANCAEKFDVHPITETLYPAIESLRATDGEVNVTAQFGPGPVVEHRRPGTLVYVRQCSPVNVQLSRDDKVVEISGTAIREWGAGANWFPFDRLK